MKNFLQIITILFIGITAYAAEISNEAYTELVYGRSYDSQVAFQDACAFTKYDCSGLSPPNVVWGPLPGLYGTYDGKDTIYVIEGMFGYFRKAVLMHETIHYLQVKRGGLELPGWADKVCPAENEAFGATDEWLRSVSQYHLIVGPDWWKKYSYCKEFYDPDYSPHTRSNIFIESIIN